MKQSDIKAMLEEALVDDDNFKRGWAYARAIVKLGSVEELNMAQAIIDADDNLCKKTADDDFDDIEYETGLRNKWTPELSSVDQALTRYPYVAERTKGIGYKVALLAFSEFCSCDVDYTCKILEEVVTKLESGVNEVKDNCGDYASGRWPQNHRPSVLAAMAIFTQRPCWVLKHLFLTEVGSSGMEGLRRVYFKRRQTDQKSVPA
ncbi:MAG TPA: hypothetical protein QGH03_01595 [Candidatus Paceibacterota bacterium]|jgi:hypothetical protein|nr:hypothetical protein [Candidatus Paceibacterota bacterium]HJN62905.1 hypothetical protein [Candidatus Paceibacterota bacterium]|tara:strand:+ start:496 stop:1110 length:615 start_codon:yes stop_codon:yes gene_type:complete